MRTAFGGFAGRVAVGVQLGHDHGPQYVSADFQAEIAFLDLASSPSFVRAPQENGVAEWFMRLLKE